MPWTDQITVVVPYVCTYFWIIIWYKYNVLNISCDSNSEHIAQAWRKLGNIPELPSNVSTMCEIFLAMVTQNILRKHEGKWVFSEKKKLIFDRRFLCKMSSSAFNNVYLIIQQCWSSYAIFIHSSFAVLAMVLILECKVAHV